MEELKSVEELLGRMRILLSGDNGMSGPTQKETINTFIQIHKLETELTQVLETYNCKI